MIAISHQSKSSIKFAKSDFYFLRILSVKARNDLCELVLVGYGDSNAD